MTSFMLLVCFPATARCVCRLRVRKISKQVNLVSKHQSISALLCCSCISISWNFLPKTFRKFFAEWFRKSNVIFPEISGKIPQEISGNFPTHNPTRDKRRLLISRSFPFGRISLATFVQLTLAFAFAFRSKSAAEYYDSLTFSTCHVSRGFTVLKSLHTVCCFSACKLLVIIYIIAFYGHLGAYFY